MLSRFTLNTARAGKLLTTLDCSHQSLRPVSFKVLPWSKHFENWQKAHDLYNGPERDHKNFPAPKQPEKHAPVRMAFLPDSWFRVFYEKTGVTGPYLFGFGTLTFLLSKEFLVVEHGFVEFLSFWLAMTVFIKKLGPRYKEMSEKYINDFEKNNWTDPIISAKADSEKIIQESQLAISQQEGQKYLFEAKRENIQIQLEGIYRERLHQVQQSIKKRLDYQVEVQNTHRRFEQNHMVSWIVNNVMKGITPQQEKDSIKQCITTLKSLSAST